jgi:hypothetical protein
MGAERLIKLTDRRTQGPAAPSDAAFKIIKLTDKGKQIQDLFAEPC